MTEGSNRLPILAAEAKKAHADVEVFTGMAAVQALKAGAALVEAKALCGHGNWTSWLKSTGISERSAQRYMLLHRAGLKPAIVADLGFAFAEKYASLGMKLLPSGDAATWAAYGEDLGSQQFAGMAYWWREEGPHVRYWCIQYIDEREILQLHHTIPIWLLGAMEFGHADRFDQYRLVSVPQIEAKEFIEQFEAAA